MYVALLWGACELGERQPSQSNLFFTFLFFSYSAANCVLFLSSTASTSLDMRKKKKILPENWEMSQI